MPKFRPNTPRTVHGPSQSDSTGNDKGRPSRQQCGLVTLFKKTVTPRYVTKTQNSHNRKRKNISICLR